MLLATDGSPGTAGSGPRLGVIPLEACHYLTHRTSRAIGKYEPARSWFGSGQLLLACARCSLGHTRDVSGAGVQEALGPEVKLVGGQPPGFHRYRRHATASRCDPTALLAHPLAPRGVPAGQRETGNVGLRRALQAEPRESV